MFGSRLSVGARAALLALALVGPVATALPSSAAELARSTQLLDVPYVPQSGELCGGAALAMVLRYWGEAGVMAEDFAPLVEAGQGGIPTRALVEAVSSRGWTGFRLQGRQELSRQLEQGRPVLALLQVGADAYHYVVLVAWANGWVVYHDPKLRPFQAVREERFEAAWSGSDGWALLVLPPQPGGGPATLDPPRDPSPVAPPLPDEAGARMAQGALRFQRGDRPGAEREFGAARALCPTCSAPLLELAGLRFHAGDWAGAARLAELALELDPGDAYAWRLLAGSRFLDDDVEAALDAWNQLSEPRHDLTRIDGLSRTRYSVVATQLQLQPGALVTPESFGRARRRLAELPAQDGFRLGLRPLPGGVAQVDVALVERPLVARGPWALARAATEALTRHQITVDVSSPTSNGELWTGSWRWAQERPRVSLALAAPAAGGRPGIWGVEASRERQAYVARPRYPRGGDGDGDGELAREERQRVALSFTDWIDPGLRLEVGTALDKWSGRGRHLALEGRVEARWWGDRLSATLEGGRWLPFGNSPTFAVGAVGLAWGPGGPDGAGGWLGSAGFARASADAPLALWSGAGTGDGRAPLLRAHPLLEGGILTGQVFGRTLAHATIERQGWAWRAGPLQLGWALFVDGARPWETGRAEPPRWQLDGGGGLRLRSPGLDGQLRLDLAHGFTDGDFAASIAWQHR